MNTIFMVIHYKKKLYELDKPPNTFHYTINIFEGQFYFLFLVYFLLLFCCMFCFAKTRNWKVKTNFTFSEYIHDGRKISQWELT